MNDTVLQLDRLIAAPPEQVFDYWTDPALLVRWWGPEGADVPAHDIDMREGGTWRTTMRLASGTHVTVSVESGGCWQGPATNGTG